MDVTEYSRINELKRRVEKDPTSIAFAQLAEEYRRIGDYQQAVDVCRDGLSRHPGYVSARVTLARALMELDEFVEAKDELKGVLAVAPDNLAAIRALADIHQKTGDAEEETPHIQLPVPAPPPVKAAALIEAAPTIEVPLTIEAPMTIEAPLAIDEESAGIAALPEIDSLPALDALESLSLDLSPLPEMNWDFDAALQFDDAPVAPRPHEPPVPVDPALGELEGWLAAIIADRAEQR